MSATLDAQFALVGPNFVMIASDLCQMRGAIILDDDVTKMHKLSTHIIMSCVGNPSDTFRFCEYISKRYKLFRLQNGFELSVKAIVNVACRYLAENLRTPNAMQVNTLVAGWDEQDGPQLFFMDHFGSMVEMKKAGAHGLGGLIATTILDKQWTPHISQEEAHEAMTDCAREIHTRLFINLPNFAVAVVDEEGVSEMPDITVEKLHIQKYEERLEMGYSD